MRLWETEFYALSVLNGDLESFRGIFIEAPNIQEALRIVRRMKLDYLQLTGVWYKDFKAIRMEEEFEEVINEGFEAVKSMSYDEVMDWLDKASDREDLERLLIDFGNEKGMEEHKKIIEQYLKDYDKRKDSNESEEEDVE